LDLNEIALASFDLNDQVAMDCYKSLPSTGAFIVIDRLSNVTVGAGMITYVHDNKKTKAAKREYTPAEIALNTFIREHYPEWGCLEIN